MCGCICYILVTATDCMKSGESDSTSMSSEVDGS